MGHHVTDGATGAKSGNFHQSDFSFFTEKFLGLLEWRKDEGIVLGAGLVEDTGDLELFSLYLDGVAGHDVKSLGRVAAEKNFAFVLWRVSEYLPPLLHFQFGLEIDPDQEDVSAGQPDSPEDLR